MSFAETALLGAIAGFTIFLGLPIGRAEGLSVARARGLSMLSAGILAFLFMDVGGRGPRDHRDPSGRLQGRTTPRCGR